MADQGPILFYDGDCGLCARSVQWSLRHDRRGVVRFAPLQGSTYAGLALADKPTGTQTVVLYQDGRLFVRSEAGLRLVALLGGVRGMVAKMARVVPRKVRDWVYDRIAARRIAWFGTADRCRLPAPEHAGRFLP